MIFEDSPSLSDFYSSLVSAVSEFSYRANPDGQLVLPPKALDPNNAPLEEISHFVRERIDPLLTAGMNTLSKSRKQSSAEDRKGSSWVFPTIQMGPFGIHHDEQVTRFILESVAPKSTLDLGSAYFNITDVYKDAILNESSKANINIITASPQVMDCQV